MKNDYYCEDITENSLKELREEFHININPHLISIMKD